MRDALSVCPGRDADFAELAANLRPVDRVELETFNGKSADQNIANTRANALSAFAVRCGGRLVCVYGLGKDRRHDHCALAWLLATPLFAAHRHAMARQSRSALERLSHGYAFVYNYVDGRNEATLRWLDWLGFGAIQRLAPWRGSPAGFVLVARFRDDDARQAFHRRRKMRGGDQ